MEITAALARLDEFYAPADDPYALPAAERDRLHDRAGPRTATYGELEPESWARILTWARPGPRDVVADLGSGAGRLVLLTALLTPATALGVELSPTRHRIARTARARLQDFDAEVASRVRLRLEDLRDADASSFTLVYTGATCFGADLLGALERRLHSAPRLRLWWSTKALPPSSRARWRVRGELRAAASWDPRTRLHLYEKVPKGPVA